MLNHLQELWQSILREKSFGSRTPYLAEIRDAAPEDVIDLFSQKRIEIKPDGEMPTKTGNTRIFCFAERWHRGRFWNFVCICIEKKRTRCVVDSIECFEWVDFGRLPLEMYFVTARVIAATGSGATAGGTWKLKWSGGRFTEEVEEGIPRLREYPNCSKLVPCIWSLRDSRLKAQMAGLASPSRRVRESALTAISDMEWNADQLPKIGERVIRDGATAIRDLLSWERTSNPMPFINARGLIWNMAPHVPQLGELFGTLARSRKVSDRIAAANGLPLIVKRQHPSIPILLELITDREVRVRRAALMTSQELHNSNARPAERQLVHRILQVFDQETDEMARSHMARHLIFYQNISPEVKKFVRQTEGIQQLAWRSGEPDTH